ncbi:MULTISPECIES: ion channel protein [unclassified Nocardioides]|uniref:ion channel protein n=1 Tax=unclassified Nocardioides TaxID=2615069 RepID=UPI000B1072BB|nr:MULTISPECIES: ion channel protein [unclassified Nocardioides]
MADAEPAAGAPTVTAGSLLRQVPPAIVVGVGSGLTLIGISLLAGWLEGLIWDDLPPQLGVDPDAWWWTILLLTCAGALAGLVVWKAPGHAGPDPATIELVSAPLPLRALPGLAAALIITLAGGISLGPENPIIGLNVALAAVLGMRLLPKTPAPFWIGLAVAGTLGAMFGTPVGAALLLSETSPGDQRIPLWNRMFGPLVAAGAGAATMFALSDLDLAIPVPGYSGFHTGDLFIAMLIASGAAVIGLVAVYAFPVLHDVLHRVSNPFVLLTGAGFVLGILGVIGGRESLFKGLDEMKDVSAHIGDYSAGHLALLSGVKLLALLVAASAGFRGGRIFPALFIGVMLGWLVVAVFPDVAPAVAITAACVGILVAVTRNGWLALFMALTVVPDADLLPILVLAALPAWLIVVGRPLMIVEEEPAA